MAAPDRWISHARRREMLRDLFKPLIAIMLTSCALLLPGCSGNDSSGEPVAASGSGSGTGSESVVIGKVLAATTEKSSPGGELITLAAGVPIDVSVQEMPEIKATVGDDGTFTLRGLPAGSFTLVFKQGGVVIGQLKFDEVAINQQITISVQIVGGEIVLMDEDRRGIGHAGIELEGLVQSVVSLSLTGDSTFVIAGRTVIARPGVTAIRKGTTRKTVSDVTVGLQVHVKGTTIEASTDVLAYEIKLQDDTTGTGEGTEKVTICHIPPGKPDKKNTLSISISAWPAHQAHGDTQGPC